MQELFYAEDCVVKWQDINFGPWLDLACETEKGIQKSGCLPETAAWQEFLPSSVGKMRCC